MDVLNNAVYNYNQIYDTLKTLKVTDYLSDKRNKIHNSLYISALSKLILNVNDVLSETLTSLTDNFEYTIPKNTLTVVSEIVNEIMKYYIIAEKNNSYKLKTRKNNQLDKKLIKFDISSSTKEIIENENQNILCFNNNNYQFVEYKSKYWLDAPNVLIIYSNNLIKLSSGNYIRLTIGPVSLSEFWDTDYITKNIIFNDSSNTKYTIENIDYINGQCKLYDKLNSYYLTVNLENINDLNSFEYNCVTDNYDELFHIKRKNNII